MTIIVFVSDKQKEIIHDIRTIVRNLHSLSIETMDNTKYDFPPSSNFVVL